MAGKLVQCRSCGKEVSSSVSTCPNCGAKNPYMSMQILKATGFLFLLLVLGALFFKGSEMWEARMESDPYSKVIWPLTPW